MSQGPAFLLLLEKHIPMHEEGFLNGRKRQEKKRCQKHTINKIVIFQTHIIYKNDQTTYSDGDILDLSILEL